MTALNTGRALIGQTIQIAHEVEFVKNQLDQLAYDAANLTQTPLSLLSELQQAMGTYHSLLRQAQGLAYQVQNIGSAFDNLYPRIGVNGISAGALVSQAQRYLTQIRSASRTAMEAQSVVDRLTTQHSTVTRALIASEAAPGNLAAIQVGNQLLANLAEQQASLEQLMAASARVQVSVLAAQAAEADAARAVADDYMSGFGAMQPVQGGGIPTFH